MSKKKLKGISYFYKSNIGMGEIALREAFLRVSRETLDNFGIDIYSVEKIKGALDLIEQWALIEKEQNE